VPEGDTLYRTAAVLREVLEGRVVIAARGRSDGVALGRVVGSHVDRVEAHGKHLLMGFSNGLTLHTHLRMHGSWHRYRTEERWRRGISHAVATIEVPGTVAVCFDAPTVELLDTRALGLHPALSALGPDLRIRAVSVTFNDGSFTAQVAGGPEVRFGTASDVAMKARVATAVLAALAGSPVKYVDVSVPAAPVSG